MSLLYQPITNAWLGPEVTGASRIRLQFAAQLSHVNTQVLRLFAVLRSPHLQKQLPLRNDLPCIADKGLQQLELDGRQVYLCTVQRHNAAYEVDRNIARAEDRPICGIRDSG